MYGFARTLPGFRRGTAVRGWCPTRRRRAAANPLPPRRPHTVPAHPWARIVWPADASHETPIPPRGWGGPRRWQGTANAGWAGAMDARKRRWGTGVRSCPTVGPGRAWVRARRGPRRCKAVAGLGGHLASRPSQFCRAPTKTKAGAAVENARLPQGQTSHGRAQHAVPLRKPPANSGEAVRPAGDVQGVGAGRHAGLPLRGRRWSWQGRGAVPVTARFFLSPSCPAGKEGLGW